MLADGSKRAVEWPGIDEALSVSIPFITYAEADQFRGWQGQSVVWRDNSGRVKWVRIEGVDTSDTNMFDDKVTSVSMPLVPVTNTAEV